MRELLAQEFLFVRREIDDQQPTAGTQYARRFLDGAAAVVEEVQHLMQDDDVEGIVGERQVVEIALAHAAVLQAGALEAVARQEQHVERQIEAEAAFDFRAEQFEHAAGAGAEVEQRAERLVAERLADRRFDGLVGNVQFADAVPLGGMFAEIELGGCGALRAPRRGARGRARWSGRRD